MAATGASSSTASQNTKNKNKNKNQNKTTNTKKKKKQNTTGTESGNNALQNQPGKRKKSPGVRVIHGRIYDSVNGKCCHQCRQKTLDFAVSCKSQSENKQCTFHFCHTCLLNRYGEKAEEMAALGDWKCPKCRGVCNCSQCMKKRGCCPTGRLVHAAKAIGFYSVSEMLQLRNSEEVMEDVGASSENETASEKKELAVASTRGHKRRNSSDGESNPKPLKSSDNKKKSHSVKLKKLRKSETINNSMDGSKDDTAFTEKRSTKKSKEEKTCRRDDGGQLKIVKSDRQGTKKNHASSITIEDNEAKMTNNKGASKNKQVNGFQMCQKKNAEVRGKVSDVEFPVPQGIELTNVANIDLPAEDIGHALQFLEFCEAFAKVLDLKKGQPECLLRELTCGLSSRRSKGSSIVQFHIKLLSVIQKDSGKGHVSLKTEGRNSWLQALSRCISESQYQSKELLLDCFNLAADGYGELSSSKKLLLLNFLCDEALDTAELRSWIDEQNLEFVEEEKKTKEKLPSEREKGRNMKMNLQDEVARAIVMKNGAPLSVSEYQELVSKVKAEVARTLAATLEAKDTVMKKKQRSDAVRSEPILLDGNGRKFWKLRGYSSERDILLQDIGNGDSVTLKEKWFSYNVEERATVEKYISRQLRK
ncbi:hypothetical protein ACSBR2_024236 [Camellia fascicularis]